MKDVNANVYVKKVLWKNPGYEGFRDKYIVADLGKYVDVASAVPFVPYDSFERMAKELHLRKICFDDIFSEPEEPVTLNQSEGKPVLFTENIPMSEEENERLKLELEHVKIAEIVDGL